jgi:hypothetical protein
VQQARAKWQQAPELPRTVQQELAAGYHQALGKVVAAWPEAFAGTDLDPANTRKRMEKLLARIETQCRARAPDSAPGVARELLAQRWRERSRPTRWRRQAVAHAEESRGASEQEVRNASRSGRARAAAGRRRRSAQRAFPARLPQVLRSAPQ